MRSRVRVPSSPPANLIRNKHMQEPTYLQQLQLGHIGPQLSTNLSSLTTCFLLWKPNQILDLGHGLPLLALEFMHVFLSGTQLGVAEQLFHDHGWNGPFISAECRERVATRVPGEMRDAKSLANWVNLAVDEVAIGQRSAGLAREEPVFRRGIAGNRWDRASSVDVRTQDLH